MPKKLNKILEDTENENDEDIELDDERDADDDLDNDIDDADDDDDDYDLSQTVDEKDLIDIPEDMENLDNLDEDNDLDNSDTKSDLEINLEDNEIIKITSLDNVSNFVPKNKRISRPFMTKYELVRVLGERTKQLSLGAKPLIKNYARLSSDRIAEEELKLNMIPYKIVRPMPNGNKELWEINELSIEHLMYLLDND